MKKDSQVKHMMGLIIGGHMRSGKTLLWELCNSHPDILLTLEFGCYIGTGKSYLKHSREMLRRCWVKRNDDFLIGTGLRLGRLLDNCRFVMQYLLEVKKLHAGRIRGSDIQRAMRNCVPEAPIVGDKFPYYVFILNRLVEIDNLACVIDDNGLIIRVKKHTRYAAWFGRHGLQVISPDWLFTPEAYKEVGGMKPEYEYIFDTDLFYRMASEGIKFVYINTPLIGFRYHPDSKTVSEQERFINEFRIRRSLTKNYRKSVINRALIKKIFRVSQTLNGNIFRNILQTNRYRGVHWREFEKES